jgi:ABC-2 type transport system ATP-binding protein
MVSRVETGAAPQTVDLPGLAVELNDVWRSFGSKTALRGVSLEVKPGEIHAILGPNGAGKTTLLRILSGLVDPDEGGLSLLGQSSDLTSRRYRKLFGLVPSGDRTFYLRLSGLQNLSFFGRLHGMRRRASVQRAWECLEEVGLTDAAKQMVGTYSHGMQKRLSVARAMLISPPILLVDEATHDLDPEGARTIQDLIGDRALAGAAVLWATQRIDEIRGFAHRVTVLDQGEVRFAGTVPQLMRLSSTRTYVVELHDRHSQQGPLDSPATAILDGLGKVIPLGADDPDQFFLCLADDTVLGDALAALVQGGVEVRGCREARSELESAFLSLTGLQRRRDDHG